MSDAVDTRAGVIAKVTALPGKRDDLIAALRVGLATADGEAGTIYYMLHEDASDADVVWFYELYADQDSFIAHGSSEAFKALGKTLAPFVGARPELTFLKPVAGKGL